MGRVLKIFICPDKGQPMQEVKKVLALAGRGLEGDRYALGKGAWSNSTRKAVRHVSLISLEAIRLANLELEVPFLVHETRRNIITTCTTDELNDLVGRMFRVGNVIMRGAELCDPCVRPSVITKKEGFDKAFFGRGGLRAEIRSSAEITIGDRIRVI